jgi:hypothetical protein
MEQQLLWKRAVRRSMEQVRREPRTMNFDQACELSAQMIDGLRRHVAGSDDVSEREVDRRVSLYHIQCEALERRLAATWRKVVVTK